MRVIGTGWRYWGASERARDDMWEFMDGLLDIVLMTTDPVLQLLIGGGDAGDMYQNGADRWLYLWAEANQEYHGKDKMPDPIIFRADWDKLGKAAGPVRNQLMVMAGADLCVGFVHPESRGTVDCLNKARLARIPRLTVAWRPDQDPVTTRPEAVHGATRPIPLPTELLDRWTNPTAEAA